VTSLTNMAFTKLINKLFGQQQPKSTSPQQVLIKRPPRIPKEPIHQLSFEFQGPPKTRAEIANVSVGGLGFVVTPPAAADSPHWPPTGTITPSIFTIGAQPFPVEFKLIYVGPSSAGGAFVNSSREMLVALQQHLDAELAGAVMSYIGPEMLNPEPDGAPHWFQSERAELFLVEKNNEVLRFNLMCFGNYVESETGKPLRFGQIVDNGDRSKPSYNKGSAKVHWAATVEPATLIMISRLVKHIPKLPPQFRDGILNLIKAR